MDSNGSGRRRFLKQAAALAGVAAGAGAGAEWAARGQSAKLSAKSRDSATRCPSTTAKSAPRRENERRSHHLLHAAAGLCGDHHAGPLHFVQHHSSHFPDIDAQQHRLTIHGMVDRPLSFSMDDLKRLPSVSRIHFLECHANSSPMIHDAGNANMGLPVQYHSRDDQLQRMDRRAAFRVVERGRREKRGELAGFGRGGPRQVQLTPFRWQRPWTTCLVAYGQNGEPVRPEQGYPIRLIVPGWEGPFNVKYLSHIKVMDEPYHTWNESMNHSVMREPISAANRAGTIFSGGRNR